MANNFQTPAKITRKPARMMRNVGAKPKPPAKKAKAKGVKR
jgi:hypothetical protein